MTYPANHAANFAYLLSTSARTGFPAQVSASLRPYAFTLTDLLDHRVDIVLLLNQYLYKLTVESPQQFHKTHYHRD